MKPAAGSVFGAVLSSVEVQAPSFHPLVFVIFSLMDRRSYCSVTPYRFGTAVFAATDFGRRSNRFLGPAGSGPVAHALNIFFCVVAVAIAVAKSERKVTAFLPHPQPLGRDA
jgi:hypothetical protein